MRLYDFFLFDFIMISFYYKINNRSLIIEERMNLHNKFRLPKIQKSFQTNRSNCMDQSLVSQAFTLRSHHMGSQHSVTNILKNVKNQLSNLEASDVQKRINKIKKTLKLDKDYLIKKNRQKKVISNNISISTIMNKVQEQDEQLNHYQQTIERKVVVKQISVKTKPPQRYKSSMVIYQNSLILFGGIGCQKDLSWAKISFTPLTLTLPEKPDSILKTLPLYGHTMTSYKSLGLVYGGTGLDANNDLTIINLKNMKMKAGQMAPFRRKQHAATMVGKYMIIHGGVEGSQTKNNLFYYDIQNNNWITFSNSSLPYLSHHKMVTIISVKTKRKITHISQNNDTIYMFGGKNEKGQQSNRLFRINIINQFEINCEQLSSKGDIPQPRHSFTMQNMGSGNIMIYGGRQNDQFNSSNATNGIFKDLYLFNIRKNIWKRQDILLQPRHSMCSTSVDGKIFIYGGCNQSHYANGNVLMLKMFDKNHLGSARLIEDICQSKQNINQLQSGKVI